MNFVFVSFVSTELFMHESEKKKCAQQTELSKHKLLHGKNPSQFEW